MQGVKTVNEEVKAPNVEGKTIDHRPSTNETSTKNIPSNITSKTPKKNTFSLADLEKEAETVTQKVKEETKEEETTVINKEDLLEFTLQNLYSVWQKMLQKFAQSELKSLQEMLNDKQPEIESNAITLELDSQVEKQYVEKNMLHVLRFMRSMMIVPEKGIVINVNESEENRKIILNQKDKYKKLIEKNPALKDLKDELGLELEL
ncbi:MAG: hypothetical protein ACPG4Z_02805 [Chitinophagales bacterium]